MKLYKLLGRKAIKIKANVANADEVASMVEEAHKEFGHIDILVNNAGITRDGFVDAYERRRF